MSGRREHTILTLSLAKHWQFFFFDSNGNNHQQHGASLGPQSYSSIFTFLFSHSSRICFLFICSAAYHHNRYSYILGGHKQSKNGQNGRFSRRRQRFLCMRVFLAILNGWFLLICCSVQREWHRNSK